MFNILSIWPTTAEGWVTFIGLIVGLIGAVLALVPTVIKLGKAFKEIIANKDWKKIMKTATAAMVAAEETGKTGAFKEAMVVAAVLAMCKENNIDVDQQLIDNLKDYIAQTIEWFNNMNDTHEIEKSEEGE